MGACLWTHRMELVGVREELKPPSCWGAVGLWPWGRRECWSTGPVAMALNKRESLTSLVPGKEVGIILAVDLFVDSG